MSDENYFRQSRGEQGYYRDRGYRSPRGTNRGRGSSPYDAHDEELKFDTKEHEKEPNQGQSNTARASKAWDSDSEDNHLRHSNAQRYLQHHNRGNVRNSFPPDLDHAHRREQSGYNRGYQQHYSGRGAYHDRGSSNRGHYRYRRYNSPKKFIPNLNPVNIKVEFNVETNEHKYVVEKADKENVKVRSPRGRRGRSSNSYQRNKPNEAKREYEERKNVPEVACEVKNLTENVQKIDINKGENKETEKCKTDTNEGNSQSDIEISDENLREDDLSSIDWDDDRQSNDDNGNDNKTSKKISTGKKKLSKEKKFPVNSTSSEEDIY